MTRTRTTTAPTTGSPVAVAMAVVALLAGVAWVATNLDTVTGLMVGTGLEADRTVGTSDAPALSNPTGPAADGPTGDSAAAGTLDGYAPTSGDRQAATAIVSRRDDGTYLGMGRWEQPTVSVRVAGDAATEAAVAEVDRVLAWLTGTTGVTFTRDGGADLTVRLVDGAAPRFQADRTGTTITSAEVVADPTYRRHLWEEIVQSTGAYGDHNNRAGSILGTDQTVDVPGQFDRWVLTSLYAPDRLPADPAALFN